MKNYISPEIEIVNLEKIDVIATSDSGLNTGGEGTFDEEIEWT